MCQVTKPPRLYMSFRTAVPGILPVTRLPFAGLCRSWVVRSLSPHTMNGTHSAPGDLTSLLGCFQKCQHVSISRKCLFIKVLTFVGIEKYVKLVCNLFLTAVDALNRQLSQSNT